MRTHLCLIVLGLSLCFLAEGCATEPKSAAGREELGDAAASALKQAQTTDARLGSFLGGSAGYAVFPHVAKAAGGVGGAYGRGAVYQGGSLIGFADVTQGTVGAQLGAQSFNEIVVFESKTDLERFKEGKLIVGTNLSAVALKTGAAENTKYSDGIAIFTEPIGGLMVEAAVGGQQFTYAPR